MQEDVIVGFARAIEAQYMKPADIPYHNRCASKLY